MTGVIEAAGGVATGAAWSRAAEPRAGEGDAAPGHGACLNCGAALAGRYCHECGQSAHVHRTLVSIVHDLLHGVFHFEGKIWRTVPMLVLHPGQLTRRYIDGQRARYVSPLALFLFTVFLMFALFSALGPADLGQNLTDNLTSSTVQMDKARAQTARALDEAAKERTSRLAAGKPTAALDRRIEKLRGDVAAIDAVRQRLRDRDDGNDIRGTTDWADAAVQRARENPGLVLYKVQSAAYKFSWVLIVLSTPLVALLFLWRRRFGLYDHATFVTYSIGFMSLLVIALELATALGVPGAIVLPLAFLVPPVHIFAQLRGTYTLRPFSALWRTAALMLFSFVTLLVFVIGVVALETVH